MPTQPLQYLLSGAYAPEADDSGQDLYKKPSWWQRMWSQEAQRVAAENAAFHAQPTQAAQQHLIGVQEAGRNFPNLPPEAQTLYGSPEQMFAQRGNAPTDYSSIRQGMGDTSFINNGGIQAQTEAGIAGLKAEGAESVNRKTAADTGKLIGAPEMGVLSLFAGNNAKKHEAANAVRRLTREGDLGVPEGAADVAAAENSFQRALLANNAVTEQAKAGLGLPTRKAQLESSQTQYGQNDIDSLIGQQPVTQKTRSLTNQAAQSGAMVDAALSGTRADMIPTLADTMRKGVYGENIGATSSYDPNKPYYSTIDSMGRRTTLNNPSYVPEQLRVGQWMQKHPDFLTGGAGDPKLGGGVFTGPKGEPLNRPLMQESSVGAPSLIGAPAVAQPVSQGTNQLIAPPAQQSTAKPTGNVHGSRPPTAAQKAQMAEQEKQQTISEIGSAMVNMGVLNPNVLRPQGSSLSDDAKIQWMKDSIPELRAKAAGQKPAVQQAIYNYIARLNAL